MRETRKIEVHQHNPVKAIETFMQSILALDEIGAVLAPCHLPGKALLMPILVSDPERLQGVDPLAPAFALNAAKVVSRLTRKPLSEKIAVMLRPCEIRAFVELVKLKQGLREDVVIIAADCLGACTNTDFIHYKQALAEKVTPVFCQQMLCPQETPATEISLAAACKVCESFLPHGADVAITLFGVDTANELQIQAQTRPGEQLLKQLDLPVATNSTERPAVIKALQEKRVANLSKMKIETAAATDTIAKLNQYLANCVNCYNCRVACPVCYCRECVFVTDVFDHEPAQYLGWAKRKGAIKMPTDTVFYHLTRMAHMSTACVGCGQCTNACPNDIPVMALFKTVALRTQSAFNYEAGRSLEEKPPLSEFKEKEFEEVVGMN